ncbi:hypothetical protein X551_03740 [Methylibium sp. T29]|nr:hypothetical protein X551_03740 [Methylibium sp. T29]
MQPIIGRKYQSRNSGLKACSARKSPIGCVSCASSLRSAIAVARRLKRRMSLSIRQNRGRATFRRCANTVSRLQPLHSSPAAPASGACTENDMSDGAVATPRASNRPTSLG